MKYCPRPFAFLLCLFLPCIATAQDSDRFAKIGEIMQKAVDDEKVIGHNALIFHQGEVVYYEDWGQRNKKKELKVERDTIFRIYSMSKPITSVAVMQLVEAGKIDLDDPVEKYLEAFKGLKVLEGDEEVAPRRVMTVRDLLRHTSGLTYGFFGDSAIDKAYRNKGILISDKNIEETVEKLGEIPLLYHPGQRFHYSASTDVLGRVVEVASGERFDDYLQANIFDPLEMKDTFFTVPKDKRPRFAELYQGSDGDLKPSNVFASFRFFNPTDFDSGGGGLCSTIDDYLSFCKMLIGGGTLDGKQILKKETIDTMFTNQLGDKVEEASRMFQFGLGFRISPRGDYSWGGAAGTRFWVNPEKQLAILYMIQINPYGNRNWGDQVRDIA
ncbi:MAG: serine hydrolase domain-containing protein, partial [Planctomycetota bacterium]